MSFEAVAAPPGQLKVVNFFGAPGAGKSTASAGLFSLMKRAYVGCEIVTEFAKDLVWSGRSAELSLQNFVFANQERKLATLAGKVDWAVSDSPLPLSAFYCPEGYPPAFKRLVFEMFDAYDNHNFFVERNHAYEKAGRIHTEAQSDAASKALKEMLAAEGIKFEVVRASDRLPEEVFASLVRSRSLEIPEAGRKWARSLVGSLERAR